MIYFIVTASLFPEVQRKTLQLNYRKKTFSESEIRNLQYTQAINRLKEIINNLNIENYKIIIVENNGNRNTFLDTLGCTTFYTNNNFLKEKNKGNKELQDIFDCISKFNIDDNDFIVKMTGRYVLEYDSEFMTIMQNIHNTKYECVIKYGSFTEPVNYKMNDCITGLIGMSCSHIKKIEVSSSEDSSIEWQWAKVTNLINDEKIYIVNQLGINICPGGRSYFKV